MKGVSTRITEDDLKVYEANLKRNAVGQPGPARAGADSQGAGIHSQVSPVTASPYKSKDRP